MNKTEMHILIKDLTLNYCSHTNTLKNLKSMATLFVHKKLDLPHNFHQLDELFPLQENIYFFLYVANQVTSKPLGTIINIS